MFAVLSFIIIFKVIITSADGIDNVKTAAGCKGMSWEQLKLTEKCVERVRVVRA